MQPVHAGQMNLICRAKILCLIGCKAFEINNKRNIFSSCLKKEPINFTKQHKCMVVFPCCQNRYDTHFCHNPVVF